MKYDDISVIIPAYNCSEFIHRAIDSVLSQNVERLKVIVINDASTDDTLNCLLRYSLNSVVQVITNPVNRKLGASRNIGLDYAESAYVFFLDADDWLSGGALSHMRLVAEKTGADVVASGVLRVDGNGHEIPYYAYDYECVSCVEALERFSVYSLTAPAWGKLYRREFLTSNRLRFVEPYWHEDIIFTANVAKRCKKYVSIKNFYYNYFDNNLSTTKIKQTPLHLESYFYIHNEMAKFIFQLLKEKIGNEALYRRLFRNYGTLEFMPKFERYATLCDQKEFIDSVFAAAKAVLGVNGYPLADAICSLYENKTRQS